MCDMSMVKQVIPCRSVRWDCTWSMFRQFSCWSSFYTCYICHLYAGVSSDIFRSLQTTRSCYDTQIINKKYLWRYCDYLVFRIYRDFIYAISGKVIRSVCASVPFCVTFMSIPQRKNSFTDNESYNLNRIQIWKHVRLFKWLYSQTAQELQNMSYGHF